MWAGQLQLQPMLHAIALHQDLFCLQGGQGVLLPDAQNQFKQHLQLVAVQNDQSGAQGVGHGQVTSLMEPRLMGCAGPRWDAFFPKWETNLLA